MNEHHPAVDEAGNVSRNTLAFVGLANEFCHAIENCAEQDRDDFVSTMLKLLPRIYITATDIPQDSDMSGEAEIITSLDENTYDSVRAQLSGLFGEDDTFLEVFVEDMKYSDSPIAVSISEGLADIYQVLYDYMATVRDAPTDYINALTESMREDFNMYWSQKLCNVLRALNAIKYNV